MTKSRKQTIAALACGILAMLCVFAYTASVSSEASTARAAALEHYGGERVKVLVASSDIDVGREISKERVTEQEWLVDLLPEGTVATSFDQVKGQVAQVDIKKNEPIILERVGNGTSRISVPQGLEAVSISSEDVLAVGGAIKAGSFVNIYVETSKGEVKLMGEKILVLETSSVEKSDKSQISWVTLAVKPSSTADLITASAKGTIHLVLPSGTAEERGK